MFLQTFQKLLLGDDVIDKSQETGVGVSCVIEASHDISFCFVPIKGCNELTVIVKRTQRRLGSNGMLSIRPTGNVYTPLYYGNSICEMFRFDKSYTTDYYAPAVAQIQAIGHLPCGHLSLELT